jgi:hypothetical protein
MVRSKKGKASDKRLLAAVTKEMARPRVAGSVRADKYKQARRSVKKPA